MKNCATKCDTCCKTLKKTYHTSSEPHLYLRTNTFYCRIELPTINIVEVLGMSDIVIELQKELIDKSKKLSDILPKA